MYQKGNLFSYLLSSCVFSWLTVYFIRKIFDLSMSIHLQWKEKNKINKIKSRGKKLEDFSLSLFLPFSISYFTFHRNVIPWLQLYITSLIHHWQKVYRCSDCLYWNTNNYIISFITLPDKDRWYLLMKLSGPYSLLYGHVSFCTKLTPLWEGTSGQ